MFGSEKMAPCGRLANVPWMGSDEVLLMIVYESVGPGMYPKTGFNVAPPRKTSPLTFTWSYCAPTVVPLSSMFNVEPADRLNIPVLMIPGLLPGETVEPGLANTCDT